MKVSTKGRYALRVMLDLAMNDRGGFIPVKDISVRQGITVKYMEQIISLLIKAGYLKSQRGNSGGYKLAKPPGEYTVGDILRMTEGSLAPVACLEDAPNQCQRYTYCITLPFWQDFSKLINDYADSVTLADLLKNQRGIPESDYII